VICGAGVKALALRFLIKMRGAMVALVCDLKGGTQMIKEFVVACCYYLSVVLGGDNPDAVEATKSFARTRRFQ
jgi:hypothetical protein